jgi:hypothetical protein
MGSADDTGDRSMELAVVATEKLSLIAASRRRCRFGRGLHESRPG